MQIIGHFLLSQRILSSNSFSKKKLFVARRQLHCSKKKSSIGLSRFVETTNGDQAIIYTYIQLLVYVNKYQNIPGIEQTIDILNCGYNIL